MSVNNGVPGMSSRWSLIALAVYTPIALAACLWSFLARDTLPFSYPEPWIQAPLTTRFAVSILGGLFLGGTVVALTRVLVGRARWAQELHVEFRNLLGPLDGRAIAWLAFTSGVAEEMFFRGAMQPTFGLLLSALIFGGVHVGPKRSFVPWTIWAFVMGLLFGTLFEATGVLLGPIIAHVLINQRNMRFIQRHDPRRELDRVNPGAEQV